MVAVLLTSPAGGAAEAKGKPAAFNPDVCQVVPSVRESFDLDLLMTGKPADRFGRAMQLKKSLPALTGLNPLNDAEQILSWLAVCALLESAVRQEADSRPAWELELIRLYRDWNRIEKSFRIMRSAMALVAFQHGNRARPLVALSIQLVKLPAYAREGIRWIAKRRLPTAGPQLRPELLESLVEVARREADFQGMWMAAKSLSDLKPEGRFAAFEAEALFELGESSRAESALARAKKDAPREDLERVLSRKRLAETLGNRAEKPEPDQLVTLCETLLALGEPWRVGKLVTRDQVLEAHKPRLDELFIRADMRSGLNYESAWDFGVRARGKPATRAFLAHRISAGLMLIIRQFYSKSDGLELNDELTGQVQRDLIDFRPADPRLADLTSLYLDFLRFISSQDGGSDARKILGRAVTRFNRDHPTDLGGVQMAYLLAQLDKQASDPWKTVCRYLGQPGSQKGLEVLPVYAGAAVRESLRSRSPKPVAQVLDWLAKRPNCNKSLSCLLWRAHLKAIQGLLSDEASIAVRLQEASNHYGEYIQLWTSSSGQAGESPEQLCDAAVSLAVLLMQGQAAEQGRSLLTQIEPVCGDYPLARAVAAVMDLAAGHQAAEGEPDRRKTLEEAIPNLSSEQSRIQAHLWLAVVAEATGESSRSKRHFLEAAQSIRSEADRGVSVPLAPDRRSLVAFSGAFNMGAGYSDQNPLGLTIQVSVITRMALFPPAAVDADKLAPFLDSGSGPGK